LTAPLLQDHADAILALLRAGDGDSPDLAVYEVVDGGPNVIPTATAPPYVSVHIVAVRSQSPTLDMRSTRMVARIYTHSVGASDLAARAVSDRVARKLLDVKPTIAGRVSFPIRQEVGNDPRVDESTGSNTTTITETWRLETLPGRS
jgi:hypothetical protein